MTDEEVLERAIAIAVDNGWSKDLAAVLLELKTIQPLYWNWIRFNFIYDHDFAWALWGDEDRFIISRSINTPLNQWRKLQFIQNEPENNWQYHLKQMVVAEDPIKYLWDNLPKKTKHKLYK